jgi:hypothetical protein
MSVTGARSQEATIAVTRAGTVYHSPAALLDVGLGNLSGLARSINRGGGWEKVAANPSTTPDPFDLQNCYCDPDLYVDPTTNRIYWFSEDNFYCGGNLNWSDDDGKTWKRTTQFGCPTTQDYINVWTAPPVTSTTTGYPNVVYLCTQGPVIAGGPSRACVKSLDGGLTALPVGSSGGTGIMPPPSLPGCSSYPITAGHQAAGDSKGVIYHAIALCGRPGVAISRDEGSTWEYAYADTGAATGTPGSEGGLGSVGMALDDAGVLYVGWIDAARRLKIAASTTSGRTWRAPIVYTPKGIGAESKLALAARKHGHVAVAYWGGPTAGGAVSGYLSESFDALETKPVIYSAPVNDPKRPLCAASSCNTLNTNFGNRLDYIDATFAPDGTPWAAFVADCGFFDNCASQSPQQPSSVLGVAGSLRLVTLPKTNPTGSKPPTATTPRAGNSGSGALPATGMPSAVVLFALPLIGAGLVGIAWLRRRRPIG